MRVVIHFYELLGGAETHDFRMSMRLVSQSGLVQPHKAAGSVKLLPGLNHTRALL